MSQAGLCPGTGPDFRALTLGVTRPVHPAQQKCTGCSAAPTAPGSAARPATSCHGLFTPAALSATAGREMGVCPCPCPGISCGRPFLSGTDLGFSVGPSSFWKPSSFQGFLGLHIFCQPGLGPNLTLSSGSKTASRRMLLMGKIKRRASTDVSVENTTTCTPLPRHIHILMHRTEVAERIFSRLFIENFDGGRTI